MHRLGYRRQAEDRISQERLLKQAEQLEATGCLLVLEHVPADPQEVRRKLKIPTIGIGAGAVATVRCVSRRPLGLTPRQPPFSPHLLMARPCSSTP